MTEGQVNLKMDYKALLAIPEFDGGPGLEAFLENVKIMAECEGWTKAQTVKAIKLRLKGNAKGLWDQTEGVRIGTLANVCKWARKMFTRDADPMETRNKLKNAKRNPGEQLEAFRFRLQALAAIAYPMPENAPGAVQTRITSTRETWVIEAFKSGISRELKREILRCGDFLTMDELLPVAEAQDEILRRISSEGAVEALARTIRGVSFGDEPEHQRDQSPGRFGRRDQSPGRFGRRDQSPGRFGRRASPARNRGDYTSRSLCYRCRKTGHWARDCPMAPRCFRCRETGHLINACPLNGQRVSREGERETQQAQ